MAAGVQRGLRGMSRTLAYALMALLLTAQRALAGAPSYCSASGTPLQAPVVEGGSFGFSVSTDSAASTIAVGQPDAESGQGLHYAYNQVALCAYQSYALPTPPTPAGGEAPGMVGMMSALSRDGRWLAVAGTLEADDTMAQVYVYRRQSNDSSGGFVFHQKLALQAAVPANAALSPGKVHAGSLSISRDGRLVLVSWSVYGAGLDASSDDPYGAPSTAFAGSAQLYRRNDVLGKYVRAQADLTRATPQYARTQFFGENSYVIADGGVLAVSTRVTDATNPAQGSPALVVYRRLTTGAFVYVTALKTPGSDGTFAMTESGSHLAVVQGADIWVYVFEGSLATGKFVYNKRCTLDGSDMNLQANFTRLAMTVSATTLRLAVGNSLDTVFVWSVPLGGKKAYSDGTCPCSLDATLTGDSGSQFGSALAISETGKTLVVGAPGSATYTAASVLVVDISTAKAAAASPSPSPSVLSGSTGSTQASAINLDNTYFLTNPSTVLVSARRGTVGVPAPQKFSLTSWAQGSPGGAPYSSSSGYTISPQDPYTSGGTSTQNSIIGLTSALQGLGLTTAAIRNALTGGRSSSPAATTGGLGYAGAPAYAYSGYSG